jgi:GIY-YIG catalytic domain
MSSRSTAPSNVRTQAPPSETASLRKEIKALLDIPLSGGGLKLGQVNCGVYAFFDYDDEPIYVGQTSEVIGTRIRRHLTNQRTDAVAMGVLDPFEVYKIRVWPLPQFQRGIKNLDPNAWRHHLNRLEASIYHELLKGSQFGAVLNEKTPIGQDLISPKNFPFHYDRVIVSSLIKEIRGHPDIRLARRAQTIARLAQIISERDPSPGLRRTLLIQAKRLEWLANERFKPYEAKAESEDLLKSSED